MTEVLDNQLSLKGKDLIRKVLDALNDKNFEFAKENFIEAQKKFTVLKASGYI